MNVLGLFSGIGGFERGFQRAGFTISAMCEIDPYCRAVLAKQFPGVRVFGDVRALSGADVGRVDVITGGFPCTDISLAGKGAGLYGKQSGLWSEYHRLIAEIRPAWAVIENVSALRSRGLDVVLGQLAALGYDAEWHCIPASAVGAPHRRDRVWIIAYPQRDAQRPDADCFGSYRAAQHLEGGSKLRYQQECVAGPLGKAFSDPFSSQLRLEPGRSGWSDGTGALLATVDGEARALADADQHPRLARWLGDALQGERRRNTGRSGIGEDVPDADGARCAQPIGPSEALHGAGQGEPAGPHGGGRDHWLAEPDVGRMAHGVPSRVERLRALGNAVVPQIPEIIAHAILRCEAEKMAARGEALDEAAD